MIVVDSSARVAMLRAEPEARSFLECVRQADRTMTSVVSILETSMVLAGGTGDRARWEPLDRLIGAVRMEVVPMDAGLLALARDAFIRFGKGRHPAALNMGDCASYALAKQRGLPLLFKGNDFARTDLMAAT